MQVALHFVSFAIGSLVVSVLPLRLTGGSFGIGSRVEMALSFGLIGSLNAMGSPHG